MHKHLTARHKHWIMKGWHVMCLRSPCIKQEQQMDEMNYLSGEFTDEFLHTQADAGDYLLDQEGFQYRPTQDEMKRLALEGQSLLFIDRLKGK
jgi:hypothetical protein